MTIALGTVACEPGTVSGEVFDAIAAAYDPPDDTSNYPLFRKVAFALARGNYEGWRSQLGDGDYIKRDGSTLTGDAGGGGGGGAPDDAHYIVTALHGDLTNEHLAGSTATVIFTTGAGTCEWSVPTGTTLALGVLMLATDGSATAGRACAANDSRLSNATTSAAGIVELATSAEVTAGLVAQASDTRLSDARAPTTHASSHENTGGDEIDVTGLSGVLADPQPAIAAAGLDTTAFHNNIDNEFSALGLQASPNKNDHVPIENVADGSKARVTLGSIHATAIHKDIDGEIDALASKTAILTDDLFLGEDSENSFSKFGGTIGDLLNAGPRSIYEIDWAAQANQTINSDTTWVVDGNTFVSLNQANSTVFRILNGSGLQMTATAGVSRTWTNSTTTSPAFYTDLTDLAAYAARHDLSILIWTHVSAMSLPNSSNALIAGCHVPASGAQSAGINGAGYVNVAGTVNTYAQRNATFTDISTPGAGTDVLVWRFLPGGTVDTYCGNWTGGDWPDLTALTMIGHDLQPAVATIATTLIFRRAAARLLYSIATRSASGAPSVTIANTRIQVM
jgi:hypothetical protein